MNSQIGANIKNGFYVKMGSCEKKGNNDDLSRKIVYFLEKTNEFLKCTEINFYVMQF